MYDYYWLILGAFAAALVAVFVVGRRLQRLRREQQVLGLSWLQSMKALLSGFQQHRGLSTGYLKGSSELLVEVQGLQSTVGRDLQVVSGLGEWVGQTDRWQGITQHWARLAGNFKTLTAENNLNQHNLLIQNVLYLIDDTAIRHGLLGLSVQGDKPFYLLWRDLLSASEYIGQARAVGTGVAAQGGCDSISRIKLNYLCTKIRENSEAVWAQLEVNNECVSKTQALLDVIQTEMTAENVRMSPAEFFALATKALDAMHDEYDALVESVRWAI